MPSKDTGTTTKKETTAVEESESGIPSASFRAPLDGNDRTQSERAPLDGNDGTDSIDLDTFEQILEMDDDDNKRDFSRAIVWGFMDQAEETFQNMSDSLKKKDLKELSSLGHFLKGSSATLGIVKVKDCCEKIQNLGVGRDEAGVAPIDDHEVSLARIKSALEEMKTEYTYICGYFIRFYDTPRVLQS